MAKPAEEVLEEAEKDFFIEDALESVNESSSEEEDSELGFSMQAKVLPLEMLNLKDGGEYGVPECAQNDSGWLGPKGKARKKRRVSEDVIASEKHLRARLQLAQGSSSIENIMAQILDF